MSTCRSLCRWLICGLLILGADASAADHQSANPSLVLPDSLDQFIRIGTERSYTRDTLFEYINGHAEFYLSAGFEALNGCDYRDKRDPEVTVQVDAYDMGRDLHAYGALMEGASARGRPVDVGIKGFETDTVLTFVAGPYLFKINTAGQGFDLQAVGVELIDALGIDVSGGLEVDFPDLGEVTRTTFVKENYKSLDFLADVVERTFLFEGIEVTAFTTKGRDGSSAEEVVRALLDFLEYDEIAIEIVESGDYRVHCVDDPYEGKWFFLVIDDALLGVFAEASPSLLARLPRGDAVEID